ncbi:unnamed protein product [Adineta steineri]|uniref:Uncharacterized protein n=1 Tax=Adineta steineri TaxID=433720 RepID=A0A813N7Q6_9BILA|nr:unnamed protein product [Adineta steineri]CAF1093080.1 unnamed protein product [Adineta steineri]
MFSYNYTNPCNNEITNNCYPSSCYRPLQQIYKTTYSPMYGNNNASNVNLACICRPAERYKTTNMSYGSFYYDNQLSTQKDRALNYDRAIFARCYDNNKKMGYQTMNNDRKKEAFTISNPSNVQENQLWTQTTSDACCPTDCCTNVNNCSTYQTNNPCSQITVPSTINKISDQFVPCL